MTVELFLLTHFYTFEKKKFRWKNAWNFFRFFFEGGLASLHPSPGAPPQAPNSLTLRTLVGTGLCSTAFKNCLLQYFFLQCNRIVSKTCNRNYPNLVTTLSCDRNVLYPYISPLYSRILTIWVKKNVKSFQCYILCILFLWWTFQ